LIEASPETLLFFSIFRKKLRGASPKTDIAGMTLL
jgi:hypothetical protein